MHIQKTSTMINSITLSSCALGLVLASSTLIAGTEFNRSLVSMSYAVQDGTTLKMVKSDNSSLRCGDQDVFYAITELGANTPLHAVGESGAYTKVILPSSIGAFVPANEADVAADAKTITLLTDSSLRAPSHLLGLSGSWKAIYATPLPAGTSLDVIEVIESEGGAVLGFRVLAPTSPTGELPVAYIRTDALRDPTGAEMGSGADQPTTPADEPSTDPSPKSDPEPVDEQVDEPTDQEVDSSLMEEMNLSTTNESSNVDSQEPVEITNSAPIDADEDASADSADEPTARTAPRGRVSASKLEDLEAAFDNARAMPKGELDEALSELIAEFTRTREQAQGDESLARALDQRIEWVSIRIESRDQRRAIAATLAAYDARADQIAHDIDTWQQGRAYQLVGRMATSSVYTGEHLPLLYRIQGIDPVTGASRTIGYVAPSKDQDFRHLLGRVVGVLGAMNNDDSLNLSVIEPERIDPMPE